MRAERALLVVGGLGCAAALALALVTPGPALTGWLAAASAFAGVPTGALFLMMMMRLIPGAWGEELRLSTEAASLLAPLAALGFVPVLAGMSTIYPHGPYHSGFQRVWLSALPFVLRTALFFAALILLGLRMRRRQATTVTATVGLMVLTVLGSAVGVDWLMSLDPEFASSAFGLQVLLFGIVIAWCALLLLRLSIGRTPRKPGVLGGLFLTLLLLWAYLQFLPFFIAWSGDLAPNVGWFATRWTPAWKAAAWLFGAAGGVPLLALLLTPVRQSRRWLIALTLPVLAGKLIEFAWLAVPGRGAVAIASCCFAMAGLTAIAAATLPMALRRRIRARTA